MKHSGLAFVVALVLVAAVLRIVPHPPNFAPIVGMALFAGAFVPDKRWAIALPLVAMLLSDAILGFHREMWIVYACVGLIACVGLGLRGRIRMGTVAIAALASSLLFFVLSNLGVWVASGLYPLTTQGLFACYVAAIPFFQNSLAGDLFYSAVLFGGYALVTRRAPALQMRPI